MPKSSSRSGMFGRMLCTSGCTRFAVAGLIDFEHGAARPKPAADLNYTREVNELPVLHWLIGENREYRINPGGRQVPCLRDCLLASLFFILYSLFTLLHSALSGGTHPPPVSRIHFRKWRSSHARIARWCDGCGNSSPACRSVRAECCRWRTAERLRDRKSGV